MAIVIRIAFFFTGMLLLFHVHAQYAERDSFYYAGIRGGILSDNYHTGSTPFFIELTQGKISTGLFSYQVKAGKESQERRSVTYVTIGSQPTGSQVSYTYHASGYYVKPGFIFHKRVERNYISFFSANVNMTYTVHNLAFSITDPVYGGIISSYTSRNFYPCSSVEIEQVTLVRLMRFLSFSLSYYAGVRIIAPEVFKEVVPVSGYVPGVAYGDRVYFNFALGLNYRF